MHEEAHNRILIHIADMIRIDITKIKLRTVDTDVIVIFLASMPQFLELNGNVCIGTILVQETTDDFSASMTPMMSLKILYV